MAESELHKKIEKKRTGTVIQKDGVYVFVPTPAHTTDHPLKPIHKRLKQGVFKSSYKE